jgi:DNA-binding transcriptional regulator GbsR (MarR family)
MSLVSPYEKRVNQGIVDQVSAILQLTPEELTALRDLIEQLTTIAPDETFGDVFDFVVVSHKSVSARRLYQAYEAVYQVNTAKLALDSSLRDGNASSIKKALEDLEAFASTIPRQIPDETLTNEQEEQLAKLENMLSSYYDMYTTETESDTTTA